MNPVLELSVKEKDDPMGDAPTPIGPNDWVAERLAEIDCMTDASEKVEALVELASELLPSPSDVFQQALTLAQKIENPGDKAKVLGAIAPHLPTPQQHNVLMEALAEADSIQNNFRKAEALSEVAPYLPTSDKQLLARALTIAESIHGASFNFFKVKALSAIASQLSSLDSDLIEKAHKIAKSISKTNLFVNAEALSVIARHLPKAQQTEVFQQALTAIQPVKDTLTPLSPQSVQWMVFLQNSSISITNDAFAKAKALSMIASHLPKSATDLFQQALATAQTIEHSPAKAEALGAIVSHLPKSATDLFQEALTTVQTIDELFATEAKAKALSKIAPHLPEPQKQEVLQQVIALAHTLEYASDQATVLAEIAPHLPESQQQDVFDQVLNLVLSLEGVVGQPPMSLSSKADVLKADVLTVIAPHLPESAPNLLQQALTLLQSLESSFAKAAALSAISLRLPQSALDLLQKALTLAQSFEDPADKAHTLNAIASRLPESHQHEVLQRALAIANKLDDPYVKVKAFLVIVPCLPEVERQSLIQETQEVCEDISPTKRKAEVLSEIAAYLPELQRQEYLQHALNLVKSIGGNKSNALERALKSPERAAALSAIAPHLPESATDLIHQFLDLAKTLDPHDQAIVLSTILSRLLQYSADLLDLASGIAQDMEDSLYKAAALGAIAPRLFGIQKKDVIHQAHSLLQQELITVRDVENTYDKTNALKVIAPQINQATLRSFLDTTLNLAEAAQILSFSASCIPEELALLLPVNKHRVALEIIQYLPTSEDKTKFLGALTPRLSPSRISTLLELVKSQITSDRFRAEALNNLLPYLPKDELSSALDLIIHTITNPYYQTSVLENLIPLLNSEPFDVVLRLVEKLPHPQLKARVLGSIATALGTETIGAVSDRVDTRVTPKLDNINSALHDYVVDRPYLIARTFALTQKLKEYQGSDFSYERAASSILSQLAPVLRYLNQDQQQRVLAPVQQLEDPGYQAAVLIALAPFYPEFVKEHLPSFQGDDYRTLLNFKIQLALPDELNAEALTTTLGAFQGEYRKAEALAEISSYSAGKGFQTETLRAIRGLTNAYLQVQYLRRFIPNLEERQRFEAASVIGDISDPYHRVSARVALACRFPEFEFFNAALDDALQQKSRVQQIEQLSTLAIDMPELLPRIIGIAEELDIDPQTVGIEDGKAIEEEAFATKIERRDILVALAPHLPMRINREVNRECALGHSISPELYRRALYLLARGYRDALQGGTLRNDAAQDKDLLDLKDEINALSELLLMRDLEPPMAVSILGGWGGGKSYIMHLMQAQMTEIRSRKVVDVQAWNANPNHEKLSPYVGHIYQIKFDAWTFAKSDLWASLMQTIFTELDRQITLEQQLISVLKKAPDAQRQALEEKIWPVLYETNDSDRKWFLERVLNDGDLLNEFQSQLTNPELTGFLWKKFQTSQDEAISDFTQLRAELKKAESQLNTKKAEIRQREHAQFRPVVELQNSKQAQRIDALLGTSLIVLRQRIGTPLFQRINNEVYKELQGNPAAPDAETQNGLWKTLNETIQEYEQVSRGIVELEAKEDGDQELKEQKEKSEKLLQKIENTKFDIYTVAATVIDRKYGCITLTSGCQWAQRNWVLISIFVLFFVVPVAALVVISSVPEFEIPVLPWAKDLMERGDQSIAGLAAFLATLTPGIIAFQAMLKTAQKWFEETRLALQEYQKGVENRAKVLETTIEQKIATKIQTDAELQRLENTVKQLESQVRAKQAEMPENVYASLADFVSSRLQEGSYEKSLGLM